MLLPFFSLLYTPYLHIHPMRESEFFLLVKHSTHNIFLILHRKPETLLDLPRIRHTVAFSFSSPHFSPFFKNPLKLLVMLAVVHAIRRQ